MSLPRSTPRSWSSRTSRRARALRRARACGPCEAGLGRFSWASVSPLNFVQRMSGVATRARALVDALPTGCEDAHHRHAQDDARPARARALRRSRGRRQQPPQQSRQRGAHQGQPHRRVRRGRRGHRASARPRATHDEDRVRGRHARSSSTRRSPPTRTSSCSTTWTRRPSEGSRRHRRTRAARGIGRHHARARRELAEAGVAAISVGAPHALGARGRHRPRLRRRSAPAERQKGR